MYAIEALSYKCSPASTLPMLKLLSPTNPITAIILLNRPLLTEVHKQTALWLLQRLSIIPQHSRELQTGDLSIHLLAAPPFSLFDRAARRLCNEFCRSFYSYTCRACRALFPPCTHFILEKKA